MKLAYALVVCSLFYFCLQLVYSRDGGGYEFFPCSDSDIVSSSRCLLLEAEVEKECDCQSLCDENDRCVFVYFNSDTHKCRLYEHKKREIVTTGWECATVRRPTPSPSKRLVFLVETDGGVALLESNGTVLASTSVDILFGLYYNPVTQRIFLSTTPITSYNLSFGDEQTLDGTFGLFGIGAIEGDPSRDKLYVTSTQSSGNRGKIWNVGMDGSDREKIVDTGFPHDIRVDTNTRTLYYADNDATANGPRSVNLDSSQVTDLNITNGAPTKYLDIDADAQKLYWCAFDNRRFVYDLAANINTQLPDAPLGSRCNGIRVLDDFIYVTQSEQNGIQKLDLTGTLIEVLFPDLAIKYFAIIEM